MENTIEVQEVNTEAVIQLSEQSFSDLNELIVQNNYFQLKAQKSLRDLNDNLFTSINASEHNVSDYMVKDINFNTRQLVLIKKPESI